MKSTQPRDPLLKQAMTAFSGGVLYPLTDDAELLQIYRNELDKAIRDVFDRGVDPTIALQTAEQNIQTALDERESIP